MKKKIDWTQEHKILKSIIIFSEGFLLKTGICFNKCGQKLVKREEHATSLFTASLFLFPEMEKIMGVMFY